MVHIRLRRGEKKTYNVYQNNFADESLFFLFCLRCLNLKSFENVKEESVYDPVFWEWDF